MYAASSVSSLLASSRRTALRATSGGFRLSRNRDARPVERLVYGNARPLAGHRGLDLRTQPFVIDRIPLVERSQGIAQDFAGVLIEARFQLPLQDRPLRSELNADRFACGHVF